MKVNKEITIQLTASDVDKAIQHYLKDKEIVSDTANLVVTFDMEKHTEGETMMHPGYEILEFRGCTVKVK